MLTTPSNTFSIFILAVLLAGCGPGNDSKKETEKDVAGGKASAESGYSTVNGIKLYYEVHGAGKTLVLLHGGGGHGKYLGEITTIDQSRLYDSFVPLLEEFLDGTQ